MNALPTRRARWLLAAKAAVSLGLLALLVVRMGEREGLGLLAGRLGALAWPWMLAAVALHLAAASAGTLRWAALLRARGLTLGLGVLFRSFLVGRFLGAFTPSTAGLDGYRLWDAGRRTGDMGASAAVIVVEKLFGLVGMALVCAALVPFGLEARIGPSALGMALAMAAGASAGLFVAASPQRAAWLAARAPGPLRGRATKLSEGLAGAGLARGTLGLALGLGVLSHLCLSATFAATARALGLGLPLAELLSVGNAIVLAVLLPVSIGGVGVREGAAVALLGGAGVSTTDALLVALLGYLTGQVPALLGGLCLLAPDAARPPASGG